MIKFPCVKRGEFYLLSCVTCGLSTSANSAGPNHSLRIRWSVEIGYTVSVRHKKQCCSDIVFCQISLGNPTPFSKGLGANSAGPNLSLRIRWFVEVGCTISVRHKKQCCSDIVFCQISLGGPGPFSKGLGEFGRSKSFAPNSLVCGGGAQWSVIHLIPGRV